MLGLDIAYLCTDMTTSFSRSSDIVGAHQNLK